jgi:hypothetical protein
VDWPAWPTIVDAHNDKIKEFDDGGTTTASLRRPTLLPRTKECDPPPIAVDTTTDKDNNAKNFDDDDDDNKDPDNDVVEFNYKPNDNNADGVIIPDLQRFKCRNKGETTKFNECSMLMAAQHLGSGINERGVRPVDGSKMPWKCKRW